MSSGKGREALLKYRAGGPRKSLANSIRSSDIVRGMKKLMEVQGWVAAFSLSTGPWAVSQGDYKERKQGGQGTGDGQALWGGCRD